MCFEGSFSNVLFTHSYLVVTVDGTVMIMPESLIAFVDEVNDRPVGKPQEQGLMNIAASFSLSNETNVVNPVGGRQTTEGDAH
jgi:hypothetical protein